ncbi:regulatory protein RecX [Caloramator australicus]|uniref:Regulatory protein RecX n=1 Tax=Caloramator australicus RC3 TaxID=857293 RepID=I7K8D8_9CLOT|nr:regulatory protein RecX [Caloramator australicus]CCJ33810.1 RecA regulator RecX [Caloramator australicus RC3]
MKVMEIRKLKSENLYLVVFENERNIKIGLEMLIKYNIIEGKDLTQEDIDTILQEYEIKSAYNYALHLLERKMYPENQVRNKLLKKGFNEMVVEKTISKLKEYGFVNDEEYIKKYIEYSITKKFGSSRIITNLKQKGLYIKEKDIDINSETLYENAKLLALKKLNIMAKDKKNVKQKLYNYLVYRGYDNEVIFKVLKEILNEYDGDLL